MPAWTGRSTAVAATPSGVVVSADHVPDEGNHRVIRLWNRVGWYRTLAVLLLVGAVGGGVAVAADRQSQQPAAASNTGAADIERDEAKQLAQMEADRANAERAARKDAQRKADEAAVTAAEQAKSASPSPKSSKSSGAPARPNLPIPSSCAVYSGNRATGCAELLNAGFGLDQMPCLDKLWAKESGWNHRAINPSSGAGGIPQALPMSKMSTAGADYRTNPTTQIRWGLGYIKGRYKTPCAAWAHSQSTGWY